MAGRFSGDVVVPGDRDWFKVNLAAGTRYRIEVATRAGGMRNPNIGGIFDSSGNRVRNGHDSHKEFESTSGGDYFIEVVGARSSRSNTGLYWLTITEVS